jgi:hypothetical protein
MDPAAEAVSLVQTSRHSFSKEEGYRRRGCLRFQCRRTKKTVKIMDTFGILGFIFGMMGLIFGLSATRQAAELKEEIEKLKSQVGPKS